MIHSSIHQAAFLLSWLERRQHQAAQPSSVQTESLVIPVQQGPLPLVQPLWHVHTAGLSGGEILWGYAARGRYFWKQKQKNEQIYQWEWQEISASARTHIYKKHIWTVINLFVMECSGRRYLDRQQTQSKRRPQQVYSNEDLILARRQFFSTYTMLTRTHRKQCSAGRKENTLLLQSHQPSGPQNGWHLCF